MFQEVKQDSVSHEDNNQWKCWKNWLDAFHPLFDILIKCFMTGNWKMDKQISEICKNIDFT